MSILDELRGKGTWPLSSAELLTKDPRNKKEKMQTYSVRIPSAVSRPSGVSQNTLAVNLLGSAVFSFTLGHWILGGSVSVEINVTEMGTCACVTAMHFLHSSCPVVSVIRDHLQLASSTLEPSVEAGRACTSHLFVRRIRGENDRAPHPM